MLSLHKPSVETITAFLTRQGHKPFSYADVGRSRDEVPPPGYTVDHYRVWLGEGATTYDLACAALRRWQMLQLGWTQLCWPDTPLKPGAVVAVLVRYVGWWLNACRIVYLIEETSPVRKFGFAYGTLPDHAERGEERFTIEWHVDDTVWYDLYAFSQPASWLVRVGYPLARRLQKRFAVDSLAAMTEAVGRALPSTLASRSTT